MSKILLAVFPTDTVSRIFNYLLSHDGIKGKASENTWRESFSSAFLVGKGTYSSHPRNKGFLFLDTTSASKRAIIAKKINCFLSKVEKLLDKLHTFDLTSTCPNTAIKRSDGSFKGIFCSLS
mmetsp:Transcript_13088/g.17027  ORF Transcript_13088/g.17027 Transcript_13088/m.17027 type:complete len:122 (+) Transcript_13088:103-468(+)